MKNLNYKPILGYAGAIALFLVITFIFFYPILDGKRIKTTDTSNYIGMSKEINDFREKTGEEALWTNSMFSGMPAYQISVLWKGNYISVLDKIVTLNLPTPAKQVFLYFIGFFILMLVLGFKPWMSIIGATGYAMSSYFFIILEAGHNSKAHAIGYIPVILAGIILAYKGKHLGGAILTALALGLQLAANHLQITYYTLLIVVFYGISELVFAIKEKRIPGFLKATGLLIIAAVFAALMNLPNLWATSEYGKYTIRGASELTDNQHLKTSGLDLDYATQWSYGIAETMTLLIPDFMGGSSTKELSKSSNSYSELIRNGVGETQAKQILSRLPVYWGTQPFTSGPVYVGSILVFLFVLGMFIVENRYKWWLFGATVLSILLSWGHNLMGFTEFFMHYVPGYNKFRAVSMILVIAEFTIPFLGLLALKKIIDNPSDIQVRKYFWISFYIVGGIILIFALLPGTFFTFSSTSDDQLIQRGFPDWFVAALKSDRRAILQQDALRSLVFIILGIGLFWAFFTKKLKLNYALVILFALILIDMGSVNWRYLNHKSFENPASVKTPFPPTQADEYILQNEKDLSYRVFNASVSSFNDASTSFYHKSIGGYHGAKLRRYQDLIDRYISKGDLEVLNMLNTKYFIVPDDKGQPIPQLNTNALGNAWLVDKYELVDNPDKEIEALDTFDPKTTAIVDKRFSEELKDFQPVKDSLAKISLVSYSPNKMNYEFNSSKTELVVFSEIYYDKGWNAFIDGKPAPYFRSNYVLRSMVVPAGKHEIEFRFEPKVYYTGGLVAATSSILVFLMALAYLGFLAKKHFKN